MDRLGSLLRNKGLDKAGHMGLGICANERQFRQGFGGVETRGRTDRRTETGSEVTMIQG